MSWQPIESAPKDGRYLIVGKFDKRAGLLWVKHSRWLTWQDIAEIYGWGDEASFEEAWGNGNDEEEPCYPSHWMPLPAPPVSP
jgi:hypothetical protein